MTLSKVTGSAVGSVGAPAAKPLDAPPAPAPTPSWRPPRDGFETGRPDYGRTLGKLALTNGDDDVAGGGSGGGSATTGGGAAKADSTDGAAATTKVSNTLSKDDAARMKLIDHMARDNDPPLTDKEKQHLMSAFRSFSTEQMKQADKTGLRIWRGTDAPPEYLKGGIQVPTLTSRAEYVPGARVLQMNPDRPPSVSELRHELGHLRDDMLDDPKGLKPILDYPESKRAKMLDKSMDMASNDTKTHTVKVPGEKAKKMTVSQMYDAYVKRSESYLREDLFHSPTQSNTYARKNAQEFFAEAFSVFHGNDPAMQARLREQAPEVYAFLKADAKANGLPVPDEKALDAAAKGN